MSPDLHHRTTSWRGIVIIDTGLPDLAPAAPEDRWGIESRWEARVEPFGLQLVLA